MTGNGVVNFLELTMDKFSILGIGENDDGKY